MLRLVGRCLPRGVSAAGVPVAAVELKSGEKRGAQLLERDSRAAAQLRDSERRAARAALRDAVVHDTAVHVARGSGPGGQSVNKTKNAVTLIHAPTGTMVRCQDTRSLAQNRKLAERRLVDKVELAVLGSESRLGKKAAKAQRARQKMHARARKKHQGVESASSGDISSANSGTEDISSVHSATASTP
jgi:protein subunit release factor B